MIKTAIHILISLLCATSIAVAKNDNDLSPKFQQELNLSNKEVIVYNELIEGQ